MRLIDADALINEMKKWYWDSEKQRAAELDNSPMDLFTNLAITTVKEQPTAYDIDDVRAEVRAEIHSKLMQEMAELNETKMNENNLMTFAYRIKQIAEQLEEQK